MTRKASTFRIEPSVRSALEHLSEVLNRPMNQLVNQALDDFVARRSRQVEQDLDLPWPAFARIGHATLTTEKRSPPRLKPKPSMVKMTRLRVRS